MKGILFSLLFIIVFHLASVAQLYNFKSHEVHVSKGEPIAKSLKKEVTITIDLTHKSVIISGEIKNSYKIISTDTAYVDLSNSQNFYWQGIDDKGMKWRIGCIIYSKELQLPQHNIWGSLGVSNEEVLYSYEFNPN